METVVRFSGESSRTTHGAEEAVDACRVFGEMLAYALDGKSKSEVLFAIRTSSSSERLNSIARGDYRDLSSDEIRGTGYVVDSLEAALWCFAQSGNFRDAILAAANLGDDADTTVAICGQIAGAHYGDYNIPMSWRDKLAHREMIVEIADAFEQCAGKRTA